MTPARRLLTPRWIAFSLLVAAAVAAFVFMAWWQLGRFESSSGSWQNLGYSLQWPFFAAFAVYVWWKLLRDADAPPAAADPEAGAEADPESDPEAADDRTLAARSEAAPATEIRSADARPPVDDHDDPELAAYNAYLAALHRRSQGAA